MSRSPRPLPLLTLLLVLLALLDLRTELQLLVDHVTWTSLAQLLLYHPLAVAVLLCAPSLLALERRSSAG